MIEAYPLAWPLEQPRTAERTEGPYRVSFGDALGELLDDLRLMGAQSPVISTNVPTTRHGTPYANHRTPEDPGVAVYWTRGGRSFVIACDQYTSVRANLRACGIALHHLRRLEQSAPGYIADRAFQGFARLPASIEARPPRPWRAVFCWTESAPVTRALVEERYRQLARERHPDRGGSSEAMAELNAAREAALASLVPAM